MNHDDLSLLIDTGRVKDLAARYQGSCSPSAGIVTVRS